MSVDSCMSVTQPCNIKIVPFRGTEVEDCNRSERYIAIPASSQGIESCRT
jgi:hypothetical protein